MSWHAACKGGGGGGVWADRRQGFEVSWPGLMGVWGGVGKGQGFEVSWPGLMGVWGGVGGGQGFEVSWPGLIVCGVV